MDLFLQVYLPPSCLLHTVLLEDQRQTLTAQVAGILELKSMLAAVPLFEGVRVGGDMNNAGNA